MCGGVISSIFGGGNRGSYAPPPVQAPPTPPPAPQQVVRAPVEPPAAPTPAPFQEDETKRKAKVTAKKVQKKTRAKGTTQLQIKKPAQGGVNTPTTQSGVNTGAGGTT